MNSIDVIIPTMWRSETFPESLKSYCESPHINKIFVIDNDYVRRPKDLVKHDKLTVINYGRNIYVNPAWNEGYYRSQADVINLLNDDNHVENDVFEFMANLDFSEIDIIGVHLKDGITNYYITHHPDKKEELIRMKVNKTQPIGGQSFAYGVCMFVKRSSYRVIPSLYKIWYGDDYLVQRCKNIYTLKTSKIHGVVSKTIVSEDIKETVQRRIDLDTLNVYRYNHFFNGKNWDIVRNTMINYQMRK